MNSKLRIRCVGIDTYRENIVYLPKNSEICRSQGFAALSKLEVRFGRKSILATLNMTENGMLHEKEIGFSNTAFRRLGAPEGALVRIGHPNPLVSTDFVRQKLEGRALSRKEILQIVRDIASYRYSNIELTAFVVACAQGNLSEQEIVGLTQAMVQTGEVIDWGLPMVLDKHCIGGVPGNRTTMVVVPIVAACGLSMPKTSSRAITSPAGTADTMEAVTNVRLSLAQMKRVVREHKACIAWGGALSLAPVDDIIISVERPLSLDSEGQMIASILSKKRAAGSTHLLLDIPVGPGAKARSKKAAARLKRLFESVGRKIGLKVRVVYTDGRQPIGRGIGPVLEALDVLKVLKNEKEAPEDLREKSIFLAGRLLEMGRHVPCGKGAGVARDVLTSGRAWKKFQAIVKAQGGMKKLQPGKFRQCVRSPASGRVRSIHNLKMAKAAKLAGAPIDAGAGIYLRAKVGDVVRKGQVVFEIHAETADELRFASHYVSVNRDVMVIV